MIYPNCVIARSVATKQPKTRLLRALCALAMTDVFSSYLDTIPGTHGVLMKEVGLSFVFHTTQLVLNAKMFVMPYLELIPEYRYISCEEYKSTRWALQMHVYY